MSEDCGLSTKSVNKVLWHHTYVACREVAISGFMAKCHGIVHTMYYECK